MYAAADRRWFLRAGAAGSALIALRPAVAHGQEGTPAEQPASDSPAPDPALSQAVIAEVAQQAPAEAPAPASAPAPAPAPAMSGLELQMLALVNGARTSRNIPALEWDQTMTEVARAHAADMMRTGRISHTGSDGSSPNDRLRRAGVKFRFGSENIWTYWGKVPEEGPATMHAAMMAEPHQPGLWNHIGNILYTGYKKVGIGIVVNQAGVQYLSEVFAD